MSRRKKILCALIVGTISIFWLYNFLHRTPSLPIPYSKEPQTEEEYRQEFEESYRKHAPKLDPRDYGYPHAAFISCMKNGDVENSFYWADRIIDEGDGLPVDIKKYYFRGLVYESIGNYDEALKNYYDYASRLGGRQDSKVDARTLYFLGRKEESATKYIQVVLSIKKSTVNSEFFSSLVFEHKQIRVTIVNYREIAQRFDEWVIRNPYGIREPFDSINDLISFLEKTNNSLSGKSRKEAIDFLRELSAVQVGSSDPKSQVSDAISSVHAQSRQEKSVEEEKEENEIKSNH